MLNNNTSLLFSWDELPGREHVRYKTGTAFLFSPVDQRKKRVVFLKRKIIFYDLSFMYSFYLVFVRIVSLCR